MEGKEFYKELGKYFLDVSKLIFGGVVLATILKIENVNQGIVVSLGALATLLTSMIGFIILKRK